jgi:hypothetical protein
VLHPVGDLPAAVYWRRRLVVLVVLLGVLGGTGWLAFVLLTARDGSSTSAAATGSSRASIPVPALERVVPSLAGVATPTLPPAATEPATEAVVTPAGPAPGGPCTDDMLALQVRVPATAAVGSKPTFELVVQNVSAVPCVRTLDKGLQEFVLLDLGGNRVWGSNDCFPEASSDTRTLAPGEAVSFPVIWGGLTSEPTCTAARVAPAPGGYALRGRLDTLVSADVPLSLT